jgi:hypothetical protein
VAGIVATHQITAAATSETAVQEMLAEQQIDQAAEALLNSTAFTTSVDLFTQMVDATADKDFDRLVESIIQDAARAAESVAIAVRPDIYFVRYVTPPCCSRCAVLAGRVYRYSQGFLRHPNCDCVMLPTTVAAPYAQDPVSLFDAGQVTDLSKADAKAIRDGADFSKVVNVRRTQAGLRQPGRVLYRSGRMTPEGIYAATHTREEAIALLRANGYLLL